MNLTKNILFLSIIIGIFSVPSLIVGPEGWLQLIGVISIFLFAVMWAAYSLLGFLLALLFKDWLWALVNAIIAPLSFVYRYLKGKELTEKYGKAQKTSSKQKLE